MRTRHTGTLSPDSVYDSRGRPEYVPKKPDPEYVPPTDEELAEDERDEEDSARRRAESEAGKLRASGKVVAYDETPEWGPPMFWTDLLFFGDTDILGIYDLAEPPEGRSITFHLASAAGQVRVELRNRCSKDIDRRGVVTYDESLADPIVTVATETGTFRGTVPTCWPGGIVSCPAVIMKPGTPREVADAVLKVFMRVGEDFPTSFYANLADTGRCGYCGRKLEDPISRALRIGPNCAKHFHIEHSERMRVAVEKARAA